MMHQINSPPRTRRWMFPFIAMVLALIASFFAGRYWEYLQNGRRYQVHSERAYSSPYGTIHLRHVTDTEGWTFLDAGGSVISLESGTGSEVTLYQSKRIFQESRPWVSDVQTEGHQLLWSDGMYRYALRLEPISPTTQPE